MKEKEGRRVTSGQMITSTSSSNHTSTNDDNDSTCRHTTTPSKQQTQRKEKNRHTPREIQKDNTDECSVLCYAARMGIRARTRECNSASALSLCLSHFVHWHSAAAALPLLNCIIISCHVVEERVSGATSATTTKKSTTYSCENFEQQQQGRSATAN